MKLTFIFLTAVFLNVSANGISQTVTFSAKNAPLQVVLEAVEKQTGFVFFYDEAILSKAKPVSIQAKAEELKSFLDRVFRRQELSYTIANKNVIVRDKITPTPELSQGLGKKDFSLRLSTPPIKISGTVVGINNQPLSGATIRVKGKNISTISDQQGRFEINAHVGSILIISYVGFEQRELEIRSTDSINITLQRAESNLDTAEVVFSTGYQTIPKERAAGSFVHVDNELLNRKVGTDIISRLDGVVPGLLFDNRKVDPNTGKPVSNLQIRGLFTLTEEISQPLIVVDNFPFNGNLLDINPNDVADITVLRDASAASIWGAKAGNGVIVITTKKGSFNQPARLSIHSNITSIRKPNIFDLSDMTPSEYIDVEKFLFEKGHYDGIINDPIFGALTPVQEILLRERNGEITPTEGNAQIDALRQYDVRNDFMKYIYRNELNQQYSIGVSGGENTVKYVISGGFDKNLNQLRGNQFERMSFRSTTTIKPVKKLEVRVGIAFSQGSGQTNSPGQYGSYKTNSNSYGRLYSYAQLVDANQNPLPLDLYFRGTYTDTAGNGKLLDWKYRPLEELRNNNFRNISRNLIADLSLRYNILQGLGAEVSYQNQRSNSERRNIYNTNTFYARDLINSFTQINDNNIVYNVPNGGILDQSDAQSSSQNFRAGLNFNQTWHSKHQISALIGGEIREERNTEKADRTYGYNDRLNYTKVDLINQYPYYPYYGGTSTLPHTIRFEGLRNRFVALYGNASYTYNKKYTVTSSVRRDASNLFGVKTNDRGKPLWSVGGVWSISNEPFYNFPTLPLLNARLTYGYSGNVNQTGKAVTVISHLPSHAITNLPFAIISVPGTPSLRWEQVSIINAGIDFGLKNHVVSGSIEYYIKKSKDVIAYQEQDPTTGLELISSNSANMDGNGMDVQLIGKVIDNKFINYNVRLGLSFVKYEVTDYFGPPQTIGSFSSGDGIIPYGNPYSVISFRWAGLDPMTGDPQGILNGKMSKNYDSLISSTRVQDNIIHGSALPKIFGNFLHSFTVFGFSLSANITYRLGYYFRKPTISYHDGLFTKNTGHSDYYRRWQKPGDELITNVPSMIYESNFSRSFFYENSEITVERADHIRLSDIRLGYQVSKRVLERLRIRSLELYGYFSNLNILIYKANKSGLDPDFPNDLKPGSSISMGLRIDL